jgi:hypothetical protein
VIVHGRVQTPLGIPVGHAWLPLDGQVYDAVADQLLGVDEHYRDCGAVVLGRFTPPRQLKMAEKTGVYGPWVD